MVLNQQRRVAVDVAAARSFVARLRSAMALGRRDFNVCFVEDRAMAALNGQYRGKRAPTDVLSFAWNANGGGNSRAASATREFSGFLGDIVISAQTARRNAIREGHSTTNEIRWLILHGLLHLLGYDHATDQGEMTALELAMRERLGLNGSGAPLRGRRRLM